MNQKAKAEDAASVAKRICDRAADFDKAAGDEWGEVRSFIQQEVDAALAELNETIESLREKEQYLLNQVHDITQYSRGVEKKLRKAERELAALRAAPDTEVREGGSRDDVYRENRGGDETRQSNSDLFSEEFRGLKPR